MTYKPMAFYTCGHTHEVVRIRHEGYQCDGRAVVIIQPAEYSCPRHPSMPLFPTGICQRCLEEDAAGVSRAELPCVQPPEWWPPNPPVSA